MSNFIDIINNNTVISSLASAVILVIVGLVIKAIKARHDTKKIYNFLLSSRSDTEFSFRSTSAIASHTKLSETRVAELCARHPSIRRNEKQLQSWTLEN